jgi:hypothetical protein
VATSYIFNKTGYDFTQDTELESLAVEWAILYIRQEHLGEGCYNKNDDYTFKAQQDDSSIEIVINSRPAEQRMFMKFNNSTYQIGALDLYNFSLN